MGVRFPSLALIFEKNGTFMNKIITLDSGILEKLKGYNVKMTISQVVIFFSRLGYNITKTMIQNYVRVSVLPPPENKRHYTKNHVLLILIIEHLKIIYSLEEIKLIFKPVLDMVFIEKTCAMPEIYKIFCDYYEKKTAALLDTKPEGDGLFLLTLSAAAESAACKNFILKNQTTCLC